MKGSIQKKGKTYYAVIALNGKRKWFKGGKRKDAERVLGERLSEISNGTYREIPKTTFKEFAELWIRNHAENNVKPSTLAGYNHIIDKRLNPKFEHFLMTDIHPALIQSYVTKRKQDIDARGKKKAEGQESESPKKIVSAKTISNEIVVMKEMFKHAHQWGYVKVNPAEHLQRPKMVKPEIEILEPVEFNKLLEHSGELYRVAFLTAILTGVRAGELWGLQWGDMDWSSKRLFVRRSVWQNGFQTPKSKNSIRKIDIPDNLVLELKKWKLACPISEHELMFPSKEGQITCHDNAIKRYYEPALRKAGLRHVSFHSLRHTNASLRIRAEQNVKYMSMQMGHSSIKITMDTYGHLFNDEVFNRQQVDLLQETFHSVRNPLENTLQNVEKGLAVSANPL
ncbi:MAG: tyrosine-type recombinase/integrase [Syntrophales bacterium]